jgi:DNA-binding transcriptional LysR family regulator
MAESLRISDLNAFLTVHRVGSVTASARQFGVAPSQVSKAIARLEHALGVRLLLRSSRGVMLSERGRLLLPQLEDVLKRAQQLVEGREPALPALTIAAASCLSTVLVPAVAGALHGVRVRAVEMAPSLVRAFASTNAFDAAILLGRPGLPATWAVTEVGTTRKILLASPETARKLGPQPVPVETLVEAPFINPLCGVDGQYVAVDDDCPLAVSVRRRGHEAQSIATALQMAVHTGQLVFGPLVAAFPYLIEGSLVEVRVRGWGVREPLHLACHMDRVLASVQARMVASLRATAARLDDRLPAAR